MKDKNWSKKYSRLIWIFFILMIIISTTNQIYNVWDNLFYKSIPFLMEKGIVTRVKEPQLDSLLVGNRILSIDSLDFKHYYEDNKESEEEELITEEPGRIRFQMGHSAVFNIDLNYMRFDPEIDSVTVVYNESGTELEKEIIIRTVNQIDYQALINVVLNLILITFVLTNSYLLLKYSQNPNSLLVVLFLILLFLPSADNILPGPAGSLWRVMLSPFWGIVFYHFIVRETKTDKKVKKLYKISFFLFLPAFGFSFLNIEIGIVHVWSAFWLLKGILLLRKQSRLVQDINLKRLMGSFSGIGISLLAAGLFMAILLLVAIFAGISTLAGFSDLFEIEIVGIAIAVVVLLPFLFFLIGIVWFMGSFSWSLLAGSTLDMKIRSTLIYTIVGIFFITLFGIVDYSLGEILQTVFGKFIASEFIAGIPATVGLLIFFNPIRNRVERVVDKKLNSTELDFLEKTDNFSNDLSEEGVQEGFEEYICDNLYSLLSLDKVALISWNLKSNDYIFSEIRGSNVEENSAVKDLNHYLAENIIRSITDPDKYPPQEIASFSLILPILFDQQHKWFLALGAKEDGSFYTKSDEKVLIKLTERIRLSLKFILTYEDIVNQRSEKMVFRKDQELKLVQQKVVELEQEITRLKTTITPDH